MALSALRPAAFPEEDLEFLLTLGRQCAQALERGRLFSAERDARRRMSFLAMASARLAASLDYRTTLAAVVALAVPAAGDWCALHLVDELGVPRLESVSHRDPDLQELLVEVLQRYAPDAGTGGAIGTVLAGGRAVHLEAVGEPDLRDLAEDDWHLDALRRLGLGSSLVVPLRVAGRTLGALSVTSTRPGRYQPADVQLVQDLAQRMATAVDNALRYGEERKTALTLQRSLLPSRLPVLPGLSVAHRYLPGTAGAEVGGDWYDIIPLTGGRVGLVIGDVMGRGIAAAAVMGQLRATVRACALAEDSPAAVLGLVDAAMSSLEQTSLTTCLYAVFDPGTRRLRLASSGHLPPLLVHADGGGEYVELDPGPPLGVGSARPVEVEVDVPEGAVLLLFTDGLVEGRNQPVEDGMHVLRGAVSDVRGTDASDVEALCDELLRAMGRDGRPDDDSALLAVWTGPTAGAGAGDTDVHLHLAGHLSEVARARRLTVQVAEGLGVDLDDAALLVTEVATNALRHGGPGVDLWLRSVEDGGLRVEIVDGRAESLPRLRTPDDDDEGGRGLLLVSALARSWGSERLSAGKCVWFELAPALVG
jgi:serine phosphatase RsbU (regulator of sigma subunit)/anti-sigma regulatory factor (Ser/Thr protein kinase)